MTASLLLLLMSTHAHAFSDVPSAHIEAEAVAYVQEHGIVSGYADGTFRPDAKINRAEFTKIVLGAAGIAAGGSECFPDVKTEWFAQYVCAAKEAGVIGGYPDGTFRPGGEISFVEGAKIIANAFTLESTGEASIWYEPFVRSLESKGAIPMQITVFAQPLTRGQMAEMIFRLHAEKTDRPAKTYDQLAGITGTSSSRASRSSAASSVKTAKTFPYTLPITTAWQKELGLHTIEGTEESLKNVEVKEEAGTEFSSYFRFQFPKGAGSRYVWKFLQKPIAGFYGWLSPGVTPQKEMYLRYFVRIPEGFSFGKGGSLPGMFTGISNGRTEEAIASLGLDWDKDGVLSAVGDFFEKIPSGAIGVLPTGGALKADGRWHEVVLHARLNTEPSRGNGLVEVWYDGQRITSNNQIAFNNRTNDAWDAIYPGATYGTGDAGSVAQADLYIDIGGYAFSDTPF